MRIVLDYEEDYLFLTQIYENLFAEYGLYFSLNDIINFLDSRPKLLEINRNCIEKKTR